MVARGELAPRVPDLAPLGELGLSAVDGAVAAADAVLQRELDGAATRDRVGDLGRVGGHEGRGVAQGLVPEHEGDVDRGLVGEGEDVGAVVADPDVGAAGGVLAEAGEADLREVVAVVAREAVDGIAAVEGLEGHGGVAGTGGLGRTNG